MFEVAGRDLLRARLVEAARQDPQVDAAALLGSAARGEEDRWSDVDLALRLGPGAEPEQVAERWTDLVSESELVVDHLDLRASGALYRVLLLGSTLQVDLSFWPHDRALAGGAPVEVVFGEVDVAPVEPDGNRSVEDVRTAWLYALHVRAALGRERVWQAQWMLDGLRDVLVGLCCRRLGLPTQEGRGVDRLPAEVLAGLAGTWPARVDTESLGRSFRALVELLLAEISGQGLPVAVGLGRVLTELSDGRPG